MAQFREFFYTDALLGQRNESKVLRHSRAAKYSRKICDICVACT